MQCLSFVKLFYVNTVVPVDTVHTDVPVFVAFLLISLLFKKVREKGGGAYSRGGGGGHLLAISAEG